MFLRERKENLSEVLNLKEALNQTRLEDLQKVVQKNRDVNETVGLLMEKWEEIRNFSKIWLIIIFLLQNQPVQKSSIIFVTIKNAVIQNT